jgi:hypothetical protein
MNEMKDTDKAIFMNIITNQYTGNIKTIEDNKKYLNDKELKKLNILQNIKTDELTSDQLLNLSIHKDYLLMAVIDKLIKK